MCYSFAFASYKNLTKTESFYQALYTKKSDFVKSLNQNKDSVVGMCITINCKGYTKEALDLIINKNRNSVLSTYG